MGIFSTGGDKPIIARAKGDFITEEKLFEKSARVLKRLEDRPIIGYLSENEQPHYLFQGPTTGLEINSTEGSETISPDSSYHAFLLVTDQRVTVLIGQADGDKIVSLKLGEIQDINLDMGATKIKIEIKTQSEFYTFHSSKEMGDDEAYEAINYIRSKISEEPEVNPSSELKNGESNSKVTSSNEERRSNNPLIADDAGPTVNSSRVHTINEYLREGEKVVHTLRTPLLHHGPEAETKSMATKVTETGTVAFTNKRIVIKMPHTLADDQFIIRYQNIQNVAYNLEGLAGNRNFEMTTAGEKYLIGVHYKINNGEVREIVDWLDSRANEGTSRTDSGDEVKSAKKRLSELRDLKEEGFITDIEFDEKKSEIIDEM